MVGATNQRGPIDVKQREHTFGHDGNDAEGELTTLQSNYIANQQKEPQSSASSSPTKNNVKGKTTTAISTIPNIPLHKMMDFRDNVASLQEPQRYIEQLGGGRNRLFIDDKSKQIKRRWDVDEADGERNKTETDEEKTSNSDDNDVRLDRSVAGHLSIPLAVSTHVKRGQGQKNSTGRKQAGTTTPPSRKKVRRQQPRSMTMEDNEGSSSPVSTGMDITNNNHEALCSEVEGAGNDENKAPENINGEGKKRKIATTSKKPTTPRTRRTTNPPNKRALQNPELVSETLTNKKTCPQKSTVMTKTEAGLIFDLAIEGANWGNITTTLNTKSGSNMLSGNLKRHFTTVLKKQALSRYID